MFKSRDNVASLKLFRSFYSSALFNFISAFKTFYPARTLEKRTSGWNRKRKSEKEMKVL